MSFEKNKIFEEQKPDALEKTRKINVELDILMKKVGEELQKKDLTPLLENLKQKILECYEIEVKIFQMLSNAIK